MLKVLILALGLSAPACSCEALLDVGLDMEQVEVLREAHAEGSKHDLGLTLASIAWKESMAGKYLVNLQDPSAGVFHVSIKNAMNYLEIKDTPFNRNKVAMMLINDFTLSSEFAIINLKFWQKKWKTDWKKVWASYNAGYNVEAGASYAEDVTRKIKLIRTCGW